MIAKYCLGTLYYVAKLFGIVPFQLHFKEPIFKVKSTRFLTYYVILMPILFIILFGWSLSKFFVSNNSYGDTLNPSKNTKFFVLKLDALSAILRNVTIYIFVLIHRKRFVQVINSVGQIVLSLKHTMKFKTFLDRKCRLMVYVQMFIISIQLTIFISLTYLYITIDPTYTTAYKTRVLITMIFSYLFVAISNNVHFTAFLVIIQCFRHINRQLEKCVNRALKISRMDKKSRIRMQMYCDVSDEIDELATIYKSVAACNQGFCKVYSFSMLVSILNSFVFTIAGVTKYKYSFLRSRCRTQFISVTVVLCLR